MMSDYISEDNLVLILKYLPVKPLLRFRCVCKGWKQLIDAPSFVQDHLSVQNQNPRFLAEYEGRKYLVVDPRPRPLLSKLSKPIEKKQFILFGTLHGVVCGLCDNHSLVLWNPSIRKFSSLPLPPGFCLRSIGFRLHTCYGFWIDPSSKEFKAIILQRTHRTLQQLGNPVVNCILYSSTRLDWSVIPTGKLENWKPCKEGPPVMIGGVAHWVGFFDTSWDDDHYVYEHDHTDKAILCFDFMEESFGVIEMPDLYSSSTVPCRWQGTLSLLSWDDRFPRGCEIYLREKDSWVKLFHFDVDEPIAYAFWAMEDMEERTKKSKRKREMEEMIRDVIGEPKESVRVLATIVPDFSTLIGELVLNGTKSGYKALWKGLIDYDKVNVAYDFVESLLFP